LNVSQRQTLADLHKQYFTKNITNPLRGAEFICSTSGFHGLHWLNKLEGKFRKVGDKSLWPVCNVAAGTTGNCFDVAAGVLLGTA
jgi:hypothetical protein